MFQISSRQVYGGRQCEVDISATLVVKINSVFAKISRIILRGVHHV